MTLSGAIAVSELLSVGRTGFSRHNSNARRSVGFRMVAVHAEPGDAALIGALRGGGERAFARLVDSHHSSLLRVARLYVRDRAVAEEVVQQVVREDAEADREPTSPPA